MRVSLVPAASADMASCRIRVYSLQRALVRRGHTATLGYWSDADVFFFQKQLTIRRLEQARAARRAGRLVVFDTDDVSSAAIRPKAFFTEMVRLAHVVTTDTLGHAEMLRSNYATPLVEIVPDSVDYYPSGPVQRREPAASPFRVLWFGAPENLRLLAPYVDAIQSIDGVQLVVVTRPIELMRREYPRVDFVPWSQSTFISVLQSCHVACLMHDGNANDLAKSNNKMTTSIAWGVPTVVSATAEYSRTASEAGVPWSTFSRPDELVSCLSRLRVPAERQVFLEIAQSPIWNRYSPDAAAASFLGVVAKHQELRAAPIRSGVVSPMFFAWAGREKARETVTAMPRQVARVRGLAARVLKRTSGSKIRNTTLTKMEGKPLEAKPTADEIRTALRLHGAASVLEVGCGAGRLLEELSADLQVEGCDVSQEMLQKVPSNLRTYRVDIASGDNQFARRNQGKYDVIFTRGGLLYFKEPHQIAHAINNMLLLASKKVLIWEWPEVCERARQVCSSDKLEFHPIQHRDE